MADGVDSLSVPVAAGILLHGLKEREKQQSKKEQYNYE
jgi:tRNA G18 (ribose-2'-O)-methylase SpoU